MVKMVQVSDQIYETLMLYKGMLIAARKKSVTFDDVIASEFNKANHLGQLLSRLVRTHPDTRSKIEGIAKDMDVYEDVRAIVEIIGKQSK